MLSAYFLRKTHSIMTNCKFVIGNEVKHLGCAHVDVIELVLLKRYKLYVSFSIYRSCNFSTGILPNIPFQTESTSSPKRITP